MKNVPHVPQRTIGGPKGAQDTAQKQPIQYSHYTLEEEHKIKGLLDICHYNFRVSEKCHYNSSNWKYAITIRSEPETCHFVRLGLRLAHLQAYVHN
jgi:hypothetical protein